MPLAPLGQSLVQAPSEQTRRNLESNIDLDHRGDSRGGSFHPTDLPGPDGCRLRLCSGQFCRTGLAGQGRLVANVHNYIYHPNSPGLEDNKAWNAADPTAACKVDGLYGNYGVTWGKHFRGYSETDLLTLPRVTTETGCTIGGPITEEIQALNLLSMYLDQFKRGWSHTAVYLLRDRTDEAGNQSFGFFKADYTPRKAAVYLHNLTAILADRGPLTTPGRVNYSLSEQPATMHDLLLQKSDGTFVLIVWNEQVKGSCSIAVDLGGTRESVRLYDPTVGTSRTETLTNTGSIRLSLSDHPVMIEFRGEQ